MKKLIVRPLKESTISIVIVIDALDECKDDESVSAILFVLGEFVGGFQNVKFFITSRPESRIQQGFRLPQLAKKTDMFVLHKVEPNQVNRDIRLFFTHKFSELRKLGRATEGSPTKVQLDALCERAAGYFSFAMATIRFIDQESKTVERQLGYLLKSLGSELEGRVELKEVQGRTLNSLYMTILQDAYGDYDPGDGPDVQTVLGAVVLATNPLSPSAIATLLGFYTNDISSLLLPAQSLLIYRDADHPVKPFHKSFPDFITDPTRCTDPRFYLSRSDQHANLLVNCLGLMNQKLKRNMCKLPDGVVNSEVDDLQERIKKHIGKGLEYACRSWHKHLIDKMPPQALKTLQQFLEEKFLFWLEVLSVIGAVREAINALEATMRWVDVGYILCLSIYKSSFSLFRNHLFSPLPETTPVL